MQNSAPDTIGSVKQPYNESLVSVWRLHCLSISWDSSLILSVTESVGLLPTVLLSGGRISERKKLSVRLLCLCAYVCVCMDLCDPQFSWTYCVSNSKIIYFLFVFHVDCLNWHAMQLCLLKVVQSVQWQRERSPCSSLRVSTVVHVQYSNKLLNLTKWYILNMEGAFPDNPSWQVRDLIAPTY